MMIEDRKLRNSEVWKRIRNLDDAPKDEKWNRPKNLSEARDQIERTYQEQAKGEGWDQRQRKTYEESIGLEYKPLPSYTKEELTIIYDDMVSSRMILVND